MYRKLIILALLTLFGLACENADRIVMVVPLQPTEIPALPAEVSQAAAPAPAPTFTPIPPPEPTPTPQPTPTPGPKGLARLSTTPDETIVARAYDWHGFVIAFILPLICFGIPAAIIEVMIAQHVQPRSIDLTGILIKAQDGLFINAVVSMTARKTLSLVSTTVSWSRVRDVVEKAVEQELIREALNFNSLSELETNLKELVERFTRLPVILELSRDFGVEVLRFNIEVRYPVETIDAINRRAEAAAGGQAYVAYARSAHLDPETPEARELYKVFQVTSGRVDAARNLGAGLAGLAKTLSGNKGSQKDQDGADN